MNPILIRRSAERTGTTRRVRSMIAPGFAAALALAACGSSASDAADSAAGDSVVSDSAAGEITVTDVWARTSPMATESGVVYLTMTSQSGDTLIGGSVDASIANEVQLHETAMVDPSELDDDAMDDDAMDDEAMEDDDHSDTGVMQMSEVGTVVLPAGEAVEFTSGGLHVMLVDLVSPLEVGQTFTVLAEP